MKHLKNILALIIMIFALTLTACQTINVNGKTFIFDKVQIDWGLAQSKEEKEIVLANYSVGNEKEFAEYLKKYQDRENRVTTFGTDNKYYTKNGNNEIVDSGYYKQDEAVITLSDTEKGLEDVGSYTLQANEKGYVVIVKLDDEMKIFARYTYIEQT
ncbi:MAG: hypothetical protein E7345_01140 [Clostridiales bacterium]|nr:hypothetical protein [Clostridiales bacterium]